MRTRATIAGFGVLAALAVACSSGGDDTAGPGAQGNPAEAAAGGGERTIVFEVTGPKKADVTYGLNSDQSQETAAKLPWKKAIKSKEAFTIAVLSAQNSGSGDITCKITIDGKVAKTNKSSGQYSIVTCSADNL